MILLLLCPDQVRMGNQLLILNGRAHALSLHLRPNHDARYRLASPLLDLLELNIVIQVLQAVLVLSDGAWVECACTDYGITHHMVH